MAAITVTAAQVALIFPEAAEVFDFVAAEAIVAGQPVYVTSAGLAGVADANAAGRQQVRGIALKSVGAGQAVSVLKRGHMAGATLAGAYDSLVYLSDTAGGLDTAAGTMTVRIGRVVPLSDSALTKVIYVDANWRDDWA